MTEDVRFDVSRCVVVPSHAHVAVLELEGEFHAPAHRRVGRPRLVVRAGDTETQTRAVNAQSAYAGPSPRPWKAVFAVPRALSDGGGVSYALAIGSSIVLDLPTPVRERLPTNPQDEVEGQTWGSMVVELSDARQELERLQAQLADATAEISRVRDAPPPPPPTAAPATWLDEVEAERSLDDPADEEAEYEIGEAPTDEPDDEPALPALTGPRRTTPPTMEHDAVYEATLRRVQVERRARLRRRRVLGRLLALIVVIAVVAAIYLIASGAAGIDVLELV